MLAALMVIIGAAALAAGWAFDQDVLLFLALGVSGAGLLLFGAHAWLLWQAAPGEAEQHAADERASGQPSPDTDVDDLTALRS